MNFWVHRRSEADRNQLDEYYRELPMSMRRGGRELVQGKSTLRLAQGLIASCLAMLLVVVLGGKVIRESRLHQGDHISPTESRSSVSTFRPSSQGESRRDVSDEREHGKKIALVIIDVLDRPVQLAAILSMSTLRARTDSTGRAELDWQIALRYGFQIEHDDYDCVEIKPEQLVDLDVNVELEVVLRFCGRLRGNVEIASGSEFSGPFQVVAIPSRLIAEGFYGEWSRWLDAPDTIWALTASDGSFVLRGLDRAELYHLYTGAECYGMRGAGVPAQVGDAEVVLIVDALHIATLRLRDLEGRELRSGGRFAGESGAMGLLDADGFEPALLGPIARLLAGLPQPGPGDYVRCALRSGIGPGQGSMHFSGQPVGYAGFSVDVPLEPCSRAMSGMEVRLASSALGWGSMILRPASMHLPSLLVGRLGRVILENDLGQQSVWPVNWMEDVDGEIVIEGIPWGVYSVAFDHDLGVLSPAFQCSPSVVRVSSHPCEVALFPQGQWGSLEIVVPDCATEQCILEFILRSGGIDTEAGQLVFEPGARIRGRGPKLLIPWTRTGEYTVRCHQPQWLRGWWGTVSVRSGEQVVVILQPPLYPKAGQRRSIDDFLDVMGRSGQSYNLIDLSR